jgi:ATP-dependent DNA helicase RecG
MSVSTINPSLTEEYLRNGVEGKFLERKGRDTKHSKLADELIGMLNAGGGVLVYGIADSGEVESLLETSLFRDQAIDLDQYRKIVHDYIKPPAYIELEEVYLAEGELVFIYHVEPAFEGVYARSDSGNENIFLRVADSNKGPLTRAQVIKLEYNRGMRQFEEEERADFNEEDLDDSLCNEYIKVMNVEMSFAELAYKRNLAVKRNGEIIFKNAAILLFAVDPDRYIRDARVRYLRYDGEEQRSGNDFNVVKDHSFEGPIPRLIGEISTFMEASLRDYYYLGRESGKFIRIPEFPKDAWLEGIVNALYHRSYNVQGSPIMLKHFDDRIEISNSGPLPAQVTVENIKNEKFTRNVRLARTLNDFGYVRALNEGVPRIYRVMSEFMLDSPEYKVVNGTVTLTLRNKITEHKETIDAEVMERVESEWDSCNQTQQELMSYLFDKNEATLDDFCSNVDVSEQAVRNNLKSLETLKIIEKVTEKQRDRNAIYRFYHLKTR